MFSLELAYAANLEKIQKFLKIVLGVLDIQGANNLKGNKVLSKKFDDENISYDEVLAICNKINKEKGRGTIEVLNESFEFEQIKNGPGSEKFQEMFKELNRMECKDLGMEFIPFTKNDIKENIIFKIKDVDRLKELDQEIDKAIRVAKPIGILSEEIDNRPKFPHKLPAGTKWENITFQFLKDDNAFIKAKQHKLYIDYKKMGLVGLGKNPKPSVLWEFLRRLSYAKGGEIALDNDNKKARYGKQKELLSDFLKYYFTIDLDPFFPYEPYPPYKHDYSYKIRMQLIPLEKIKEKKDYFVIEDEIKAEDPDGFKRFYDDSLDGKT